MSFGWDEIPIGEVAAPSERFETPVPGQEYRQVGVRLWGGGAYEREPLDGGRTKYKALNRTEQGDIVVNKIWARNGSVSVIRNGLDGCYVSGEFPLFTPAKDRLNPDWFYWITRTRWFWHLCDVQSRGTSGKNRIRPEKFLAIRIPLPPFGEQRRIVAKIERLAAKVDEAHGLRQQAVRDAESYVGACAVARFDDLDEVARPEIAQIAEVRGGIQKSPDRTPINHPVRYLTVAHVKRNEILTDDPRYFEVTPDELPRRKLQAGDVLIIEGNGSADQIGRTAVYLGELDPCVHQNHVIRMRPDTSKLDPQYLNAFLNSPAGQDEVQSRSRTTSGLRSLSVGRIKQIAVPLPSLQEQRHIVAELEEVRTKVDRLMALQQKTAAELDALLPSILDKAFRGELRCTADASETPRVGDSSAVWRIEEFAVVEAEIVRRLHNATSFGRVMLYKGGYLAAALAGVRLEPMPLQQAAGPFHPIAQVRCEQIAAERDWFIRTVRGARGSSGVVYKPKPAASDATERVKELIGERWTAFDRLMRTMAGWNKDFAGLVATTHAVWNALLARGERPTTEEIERGVYDWSAEKKRKYTPADIRKAKGSLQALGLTPTGGEPLFDGARDATLFEGSEAK